MGFRGGEGRGRAGEGKGKGKQICGLRYSRLDWERMPLFVFSSVKKRKKKRLEKKKHLSFTGWGSKGFCAMRSAGSEMNYTPVESLSPLFDNGEKI